MACRASIPIAHTKRAKMANVVALIASALCIFALAGSAQSHQDEFIVRGDVYCDACRVFFRTKLSESIAAAEVELKCRSRENNTETLSVKSQTDEAGFYEIVVNDDHEDDICQVSAVHSPLSSCFQIVPEISTARVCLAANSGLESNVRYANSIGFTAETALPECKEALTELDLIP